MACTPAVSSSAGGPPPTRKLTEFLETCEHLGWLRICAQPVYVKHLVQEKEAQDLVMW